MIHESDSERCALRRAWCPPIAELSNSLRLVVKLLGRNRQLCGSAGKFTKHQGSSPLMVATQTEFRSALGSFATGVTVITVDYEGEVHGMTANAFSSVSLDPPLVLVCVDHRARTHAHLHARKRFGVNVLAHDQQIISEYYARPAQDHRHAEQEAGAHFDRTAHGTPVLNGALAYLECRLHSSQDAGDHTIFIAEVEEVVVRGGDPLLYYRGEYRTIGRSGA
jgi:flavin reductase (DIM6/NTAB) family NADH-FMN oxidoreductase RutF